MSHGYALAFLKLLDKDLIDFSSPRKIGIGDWVATGNYKINTPSSIDTFFIQPVDAIGLTSAFAFEVGRFSSAAQETLTSIVRNAKNPKSSSWLFIKFYYAAFFSAQSLLRLSGKSYTHLRESQIEMIQSIFKRDGYACDNLEIGYYVIKKIKNVGFSDLLINSEDSNSNSSHTVLWKNFSNLLDDFLSSIAVNVDLTLDSRDNSSRFVTDLKLAINARSKSSWISSFRNNINYRFTNEVWYPYGHNKKAADKFYSLILSAINCRFDDFEIFLKYRDDDLKKAIGICASVVALNFSMLDLIRKNGPKNSFTKTPGLDLSKLHQLS